METWPLIASGKAPQIPQDHSQATYNVAPRREHARIDWKKNPLEISSLCRAFTAGKGAWARIAGKRLYVWESEPYTDEPKFESGIPGQILAITGKGIVVQVSQGQLLLTRTQVTQEGPDLLSYLNGAIGSLPVILG